MVGVGLAAMPALGAQASSAPAGDPLLTQLRNQADKSVVVTDQAATGKVGFVRTKGDLMPGKPATDAASAAAKTDAYLATFAPLFGARANEVQQTRVMADPFGWTVVYNQSYKGVPVWAGTLKAKVAKDGDLTAVSGYVVPALNLDVTPARSADAAAQRAVAMVKNAPPASEASKAASTAGLRAVSKDLVIYQVGAVKGDPGEAVLAYDLEVSNITKDSGSIRDRVVLDAQTLKPLNRYSMMADGLDQYLLSTDYDPETETGGTLFEVWDEPQSTDGLDQDQKNLLQSSAESYWMHMNTWGIDSYDDKGAERITIHNRPNSCPNASWNGTFVSYCDGVYADDIVAHEWGHAYTEYETGLIYQWQSGALNESYSDVWGETVDLLNAREDEGEGDLTVKRTAGLCSRFTRGEIGATIVAPISVAGECESALAFQHGPVFDKAGTTTEVVVGTDTVELDDQGDPEGTTGDGCSPLTNAAAVEGKFVYVDRGLCILNDKVENAADAGATGIVVGNTAGRPLASAGGDFPIYGLMVDAEAAQRIKSVGTVTMNIRDIDTAAKDQNSRWVIGEKSPAFGGAIRDMWTPTCYGDPGKVSDAEYYCSSDDSGGVHGNSAVPNHAYALMVDGGTYNGQAITGLGLDKSANVFFYAQHYMSETSDFVDMADALETACADLVGQPIQSIKITPGGSTPAAPITAGDCAQVLKVIAAVELRNDPTAQCAWTPILAKNAPALCGTGTTSKVLFTENFDEGLGNWTTAADEVGVRSYPWRTSAVYPGRDNVGRVAFGPGPDEGDCAADDISSSNSIISPAVVVPAGEAMRLSFDHYVATEAGFDGGNVKLSINGGDFTVIDNAAYVVNPPNTELDPATLDGDPYNTNPMAGEVAFSGTNPGRSTGSWGQSQVNLAAAGVKAGDTVNIRFDMGRDGCGGVDGWYVDDVTISVCEKVAPSPSPSPSPSPTPTPTPNPSKFDTETLVKIKPKKPEFGENFKAVALVDSLGGKTLATGIVKFRLDGKKIGQATLEDGRAVLWLKKNVAIGMHHIVATYKGDTKNWWSRDRLRFWVVR
ncbi:MAG: Thermolysin metallopeptidase [Nocardioides sp.]|nr:Thermolysin metallopeptidase [Nocardioides sp.]